MAKTLGYSEFQQVRAIRLFCDQIFKSPTVQYLAAPLKRLGLGRLELGGVGLGGFEVGLGVEEGAVHGADPVGGFGGGAAGGDGVSEGVAEGLEFGFEVVEGAEEHGLGGHGELGAAELELAVMGEDHVLDEETELGWEVLRGRRELGLGGGRSRSSACGEG